MKLDPDCDFGGVANCIRWTHSGRRYHLHYWPPAWPLRGVVELWCDVRPALGGNICKAKYRRWEDQLDTMRSLAALYGQTLDVT